MHFLYNWPELWRMGANSMAIPDERNRKDERGYTYVDHGLARVGNRWLERVWSGFMGHTTSLMQKSGDVEWAAPKSPEFSLDVDGSSLGLDDFGEIEWSEECSELGATLVATHRRPGLELRVEQLAFHDAPALLRSISVFNSGGQAIDIGPVIAECVALDDPEVRFCASDFKQPQATAEFVGKPALGALVRGDHGLLMLCENEGRLELGSRTPGICSVAFQGGKRLAPFQRAFIGRTFLIAFEGDAVTARDTLVTDVQGRLRLHERLASKRALEDD